MSISLIFLRLQASTYNRQSLYLQHRRKRKCRREREIGDIGGWELSIDKSNKSVVFFNELVLTLSFPSLPASHLCNQGLVWPSIMVRSMRSIILSSVNYDPATVHLIFIRGGGLTANFWTFFLLYQGHYLPCTTYCTALFWLVSRPLFTLGALAFSMI